MNAVLYIHGQGGNAAESEHYKALFPDDEVIGLDYHADTPWEAETEFCSAVEDLKLRYDDIVLIANSIGAFYAMAAHLDSQISVAFFISPVVDMEKLNGVELSDEYRRYVKSHPVRWDVPTHILYGSNDHLVPFGAINEFVKAHNATLTIMNGGEHWFHTDDQMRFLYNWIRDSMLQQATR